MGDGADWIWNICQEQFPGAIEIVNLYHARQHLWDLGGKLHPNDETAKRRWAMPCQHLLDDGKIEKLVAKLRTLSPDNPELAAAVRTEANYFERNAERMRYPESRRKGLSDCDGLILDLRGHLGGGLGVLRLMSHLTPAKLPIGLTVSRRMAERRYTKENLRKLDHLPTEKPNALAILIMAVKFAGRDPSVVLVSEGLGRQKWHGRIVILTNEHTVSAREMVCAFARENNLAKIVGTETAGRLTPGSGLKVGEGYMVIMPKAAYITWGGHTFEGRGIQPDMIVPWSPEAYAAGIDNQLKRAIELVQEL